jgi:hypothetical protein
MSDPETHPYPVGAPEDAAGLGAEVRSLFRTLAPVRAHGHEKTRFGSRHDGGYVCLDDLDGIDAVLSFGVEQNADFDVACADRGVTVYQFDHTVDAPRPEDSRLVFRRKMVSPVQGPEQVTLADLIQVHDRGDERPNIFLKIDIEGWEWPVFDVTWATLLGRVRQITGEFHGFEWLVYPEWRRRVGRVFHKLTSRFSLVHVHANNYALCSTFGDVTVPNVLELTFANRNFYLFGESSESFPGPLDMPCNPASADHHLGQFRF